MTGKLLREYIVRIFMQNVFLPEYESIPDVGDSLRLGRAAATGTGTDTDIATGKW